MKRGIFIGRFQPFHLGHLSVVNQMAESKDLDEIIIGIGTAQIGHTAYNPFTADEREHMIRRSVDIEKPYHIVKINDINDYPRWVGYVESLCPKFDVVYAGNTIVRELFEEKGYEVRVIDSGRKISATEIRQMILNDGAWEDYLPFGTIDMIKKVNGQQRLREIVGKYMNPAVTADIICHIKGKGIVYIKRGVEPYKGMYALPGGHLDSGQEEITTTAVRELEEETGLKVKKQDLKLVDVYSKPGRDPRGPYVSAAYFVELEEGEPKAGDDATEILVSRELPVLAFDHKEIVTDTIEKFLPHNGIAWE